MEYRVGAMNACCIGCSLPSAVASPSMVSIDGIDALALCCDGQGEARQSALAVNMNRAGTALTLAATSRLVRMVMFLPALPRAASPVAQSCSDLQPI
jgi:hypothetical protein